MMTEDLMNAMKDLERKIELCQKESQERMAQLELEIKRTINFYCRNLGKGHVVSGECPSYHYFEHGVSGRQS